MTEYEKEKHTVYYHRYHIVWITKYRYKVLTRVIKEMVREIITRLSEEMSVTILNGVISSDHVHIFVSISPNIAVSEFIQKATGRSSSRIQQEFPELKKGYWGKHFWGRGYFSTISGNITDEVINQYINNHTEDHQPTSISNIKLGISFSLKSTVLQHLSTKPTGSLSAGSNLLKLLEKVTFWQGDILLGKESLLPVRIVCHQLTKEQSEGRRSKANTLAKARGYKSS